MNEKRIEKAVEWLRAASVEWVQYQGGYTAEIAPAGEHIAIASVDDVGRPVLEVYGLNQVEYGIEFAIAEVAKDPGLCRLNSFGDGVVEWQEKQLTKYLEESN